MSKSMNFNHIEVGFTLEAKGHSPRLVQQVHGGNIVERSAHVSDADGLLTREFNRPIYIFTADCIPLLFFSERREAPILAVHCGWRGALNRIGLNAMDLLKSFSIQVVVGPSILDCCFEVKSDLINEFEKQDHRISPYLRRREGRTFFSLVDYVVETQLAGAQIHRDWSRCTVCSKPELPSYRRNKSTDPQIRSWIVKKQE